MSFEGTATLRRIAMSVSFLLVAFACSLSASAHDGQRWYAGRYSFSDELGGFRIRSVSGTGAKADPIVLGEEFMSASPVTLVIRATAVECPTMFENGYPYRSLYLRIAALNNSGHPWVEFLFELQAILDQPSVYGDGLSFDQANGNLDDISSDGFAEFSRSFEPYDRLRFRKGYVDPLDSVSFGFRITDFNPKCVFYILQDPSIPSS